MVQQRKLPLLTHASHFFPYTSLSKREQQTEVCIFHLFIWMVPGNIRWGLCYPQVSVTECLDCCSAKLNYDTFLVVDVRTLRSIWSANQPAHAIVHDALYSFGVCTVKMLRNWDPTWIPNLMLRPSQPSLVTCHGWRQVRAGWAKSHYGWFQHTIQQQHSNHIKMFMMKYAPL